MFFSSCSSFSLLKPFDRDKHLQGKASFGDFQGNGLAPKDLDSIYLREIQEVVLLANFKCLNHHYT